MATAVLPMKPLTKRTRISRGQSKNGCFTCKSRKVKCDEQKPHCLRCQNARVRCEGYPASAYHSTSRSSSSASSTNARDIASSISEFSSIISASLGSQRSPSIETNCLLSQHELFTIGRDLLINSYEDQFVMGQTMLRRLILKYSGSSLSVHAACAALGAATQLQQYRTGDLDHLKLQFGTHYGLAVRLVRQELQNQIYDPHSVLASCIVLGSIDHILRRREGAALHLRGAHQALQSNSLAESSLYSSPSLPQGLSSRLSLDATQMDSDLLLRVFDVQYISCANSARLPALEPNSFERLEQLLYDAHNGEILDQQVVPAAHAALALLAVTAKESTKEDSSFEVEGQRQQITLLTQRWISLLNSRLAKSPTTADRVRYLLIRNWFLLCAILIVAHFSERETAWDMHAKDFQQIIISAEEVLEVQQRSTQMKAHADERLGFTPMMGILQSIYLAARKYRHPSWRRRAIACLKRIDREGPWIGQMTAAIAERVMQIEESNDPAYGPGATSAALSSAATSQPGVMPSLELPVPEFERVSLTQILEDHSNVEGSEWPSAHSGGIEIKLMRRKRPVSVMSAQVFTLGHFGKGTPGVENIKGETLERENWEQWTERIDFGLGKPPKVVWSTRERRDPGHTCAGV